MTRIAVSCTSSSPDLLPRYQSEVSSGADLCADIPPGERITIEPGRYQLIPTGLRLEIPVGYEAQVRPRSGLSLRHGITVLNTPGTIDSDYRGEIQVILINLGNEPFQVARGERIAQIVFTPVVQAEFHLRDSLQRSRRGEGGFGSTGT
ncbi:MAG: dUTP diphosphatase [Spirochaetaceae bacterium]|nr:MAG: dUTP diphosphatase [Spirochaetaceae bacterium]